MSKEEFLNKYSLTETDYKNLKKYEQIRLSGIYNMFEFMDFMKNNNVNGGSKIVEFVKNEQNYTDFLSTL